ncbi:MAG: pantetheine-phosphate adenylyltransferase [Candidatus Diapherotrites archaeon]|nr:pantetheine-phosphate adenylyltransferase [Candidatus Diapherotrites archaeon]
MKKKAVYAGTFDPITLGHLDVIKRGAELFDELVVGVTDNPNKKPLFSVNERVELIKEAVKGIKKVKVKSFNLLLVDFCKKEKAFTILRGLREVSDFSNEFQLAMINRKLAPEIDSVFVMTSPEFFYLNSSTVKEIALKKGKLKGLVTKKTEIELRKKFH